MANYYILTVELYKLTGPSSRKIASNKDGAERKRDKKGRVHLSIYSAFPPSTTLTSNLSSFFCTSALRTTITPITTLSLKQFKFTSAIICCLHTRIYIYIYVCIYIYYINISRKKKRKRKRKKTGRRKKESFVGIKKQRNNIIYCDNERL